MPLEKKELELERVTQQVDLDKALALEKLRQQTEMAKLDLESKRLSLIKECIWVKCQGGMSGHRVVMMLMMF